MTARPPSRPARVWGRDPGGAGKFQSRTRLKGLKAKRRNGLSKTDEWLTGMFRGSADRQLNQRQRLWRRRDVEQELSPVLRDRKWRLLLADDVVQHDPEESRPRPG